MRYINFIIIVALLVLFAEGCKKEKKSFIVPKDYKKWQRVNKKPLRYAVSGHGVGIRMIYANKISFKPVIKKDAAGKVMTYMKDGAIIIKETYKNQKDFKENKINFFTIMVKDSKNPQALNGWMYYMKPMAKKPMSLQKSRMCVGCHEAANDSHQYFDGNKEGLFRDYLFAKFK
jgi:hypothetical protein